MNPEMPGAGPLRAPGARTRHTRSLPQPGFRHVVGRLAVGQSGRACRAQGRTSGAPGRTTRRAWVGGPLWGVLLVIVGAGILASELIPAFDWNLAWPTILIAFGILLVLASIRRPRQPRNGNAPGAKGPSNANSHSLSLYKSGLVKPEAFAIPTSEGPSGEGQMRRR